MEHGNALLHRCIRARTEADGVPRRFSFQGYFRQSSVGDDAHSTTPRPKSYRCQNTRADWDSLLRTHSGTRICVSSSTLKLRPCKVLSRLVERRSPTSFSPKINPYENVRPGELDLEHLGGTQGR